MSAAFKNAVRQVTPPLLLRLLRPPAVAFSGEYSSWEEAMAHATGYDAEEILRRVAAATRKVVAGEAAYERDSVLFDRVEYSWPLLACLLQVAAQRRSLRVVDFGGSLGSSWRQNRGFLDRLDLPKRWCVVEQEGFVTLGRQEFSNDTLQFEYTIGAAAQQGVDAVLFCSSLCYVPDPAPFLVAAHAAGAPYLIIDRLPVIAGGTDRIALQTVREPIYAARYPIRLFARDRFLAAWLPQWRLIEQWQCDLQPDPQSGYFGFFLERR